MTQAQEVPQNAAPPAVPIGKGLIMLVICVVLVVLMVGANVLLKSPEMWIGFTLLWYWASEKAMKLDELFKLAIGGAIGVAIAGIPSVLGPVLGKATLGVFLVAVLVAIFLVIIGRLKYLFNPSTTLFLTIGCAPSYIVGGGTVFTNMLKSLAIDFAFLLILCLVIKVVQEQSAKKAAKSPALA